MQLKHTVLIIAGDHHGNIGDKAIVTATAGMLRARLGQPRILLAGRGSARYWSELGVELLREHGAGITALCTAARKSDLVLCGGGGLFQDDASKVKMPYWAALIATLRPFARAMAGFCIGAGPLQHALSRRSAAWALRNLDSMSVRDEFARATLAPLSRKPITVAPDPAFCLTPAPPSVAEQLLSRHGVPLDGRPLLGVAPRRWFHLQSHWIPHKYAVRYRLRPIPGEERLATLLELLAEALDRAVEQYGVHIVFLPTYCEPHEGDDAIAVRIAERMHKPATSLLRISDPRIYQSVAGRLSLMLAARMHAAILSTTVGTPVVTIGYNQKFAGFLRLLDPAATCNTIEEFVRTRGVDELLRSVGSMLDRRDPHAGRIFELQRSTRNHLDNLLSSVA